MTNAPETDLREQLAALAHHNELLTEALADLGNLAAEDQGWARLTGSTSDDFTPRGRAAIVDQCRTLAIAHPLIKTALLIRIGYIWGQGVECRTVLTGDADTIEASPDLAQQVADIGAAFIDANTSSLTGAQAQEELERALGTDGEVFLAAFTDPQTGRVQVRSTPPSEIVDIIANPEDRDEPWYYIREYVRTTLVRGAGTATHTQSTRERRAHPALGWRPAQRIKSIAVDGAQPAQVDWDAPMLHVPVNRLDGMARGVPDVYASAAWARMYRDFLVDWAGLTKALSRFAFRASGETRGKAAQTKAAIAAPLPPGVPAVGQTAIMGPGQSLEAIPKSGASIDANSGKPLAAMIAAGFNLPVTVLLADPGVTGARAVAETLDLPTLLVMGMRRMLWQAAYTDLATYTVEQAVLSPLGALEGEVRIDAWGRKTVALPNGLGVSVEMDWPPIADVDPSTLVSAIVEADGTTKLPPLVTVRLLLSALGVQDIDDVLEQVTDDQGRWIDPATDLGTRPADPGAPDPMSPDQPQDSRRQDRAARESYGTSILPC